jgi:phosphotransferase system HPr (HPr) family protein
MTLAEKFQVTCLSGLQLRAASDLVRLVGTFTCRVEIRKGFRRVNARSIIGLVSLGAHKGTELEFLFEGEDAEAAREAIRKFFQDDFVP